MTNFKEILNDKIKPKSNPNQEFKSKSDDETAASKRFQEILNILKEANKHGETYIYIKSCAKYYWIEKRSFFAPADVANNLMISQSELKELRKTLDLKTYDQIIYYSGGKPRSYNLLNENDILKPSESPELHIQIKELIENVCGHKQDNIDYLNKIILYKYHNINDFTIPAIVLYGAGGSGKGTVMSLFETIYGINNVQANLGQKDLTGGFDTYSGEKLIVEFAEVITNNTSGDKKILNKLKNIIGADKVTVNQKFIKQFQIDNIAHFFISSNSNRPIHLDDKEVGNRRFSIIKSMNSLKNGGEINKIIRNKEIVSNYLARLYKNYKEVLDYKEILALDNQDKRDLEELNQEEANQFWERLADNHPDYYGKKELNSIDTYICDFCDDSGLNLFDFKKYFWKNSKYQKKKIRINKRTAYGVDIPKQEGITLNEAEEIFEE